MSVALHTARPELVEGRDANRGSWFDGLTTSVQGRQARTSRDGIAMIRERIKRLLASPAATRQAAFRTNSSPTMCAPRRRYRTGVDFERTHRSWSAGGSSRL